MVAVLLAVRVSRVRAPRQVLVVLAQARAGVAREKVAGAESEVDGARPRRVVYFLRERRLSFSSRITKRL